MTTQTIPTHRRDAEWRLLWAASAISSLGDGVFLAALPLLAAATTQDPRLIAGVTAWGTLPWLLAALPAGAVADRRDGRRLTCAAQLTQAGLVAVLATFTFVHNRQIAVLYAVAFGLGVAETLVKAATQTLIPAVVAPDRLERANGQQNAALFTAKQFLGPPLGSLLFAIAAPLPFWADAVTFAVSAALVARVSARTRTARAVRRSMRADIVDGLRWLGRHRLMRTLCLLSGVANLCNAMTAATLVLFAIRRLHVGDRGYGLLLAAMAVGGVAGSVASSRLIDRFGGRAVAATTIVVTPLAQLAIGFFGRDALVVGALATFCSFSASLWNVSTTSLRQRTVPPELLGRVSNAGLAVAWGAQPVGAVLGGLIGGTFGLAAPWVIAGATRLVTALIALPRLREWHLP